MPIQYCFYFSLQEIKQSLDLQKCHLKLIRNHLIDLRSIIHDLGAFSRIENHLSFIEDKFDKISQEVFEMENEVKNEDAVWKDLNIKMRSMRDKIGETSFRMELMLARGHIDIKRLNSAAIKIKVCTLHHIPILMLYILFRP